MALPLPVISIIDLAADSATDNATGVTGFDSTNLESFVSGGGVVALDNEGVGGAETPKENNFRLCSLFCFLSSLFASISALLCSLSSRLLDLVFAPVGSPVIHDMGFAFL